MPAQFFVLHFAFYIQGGVFQRLRGNTRSHHVSQLAQPTQVVARRPALDDLALPQSRCARAPPLIWIKKVRALIYINARTYSHQPSCQCEGGGTRRQNGSRPGSTLLTTTGSTPIEAMPKRRDSSTRSSRGCVRGRTRGCSISDAVRDGTPGGWPRRATTSPVSTCRRPASPRRRKPRGRVCASAGRTCANRSDCREGAHEIQVAFLGRRAQGFDDPQIFGRVLLKTGSHGGRISWNTVDNLLLPLGVDQQQVGIFNGRV
jgi:hypothetical protein